MSATRPTGEPAGPLVTVIMPTHDHADTIDLACQSVLDQSIDSLELVVIGDAATPGVRAAIDPMLSDSRVRFIDRPKSPSRAERTRHEVLSVATSTYVCYHGDDDIMLPGHLAASVDRLRTADFTHPLPVGIVAGGELSVHVTDLADPRCRLWHQHPARNAVSLTGVAHRLDAYHRLPDGWLEPPPGRWSDHYMWQQWFACPGLRYATGDRLTVLKFDASARRSLSGPERRDEILSWLQRSRRIGFEAWLTAEASAAFRRAAVELRLSRDAQGDQIEAERADRHRERGAWAAERNEIAREHARLRAEQDNLREAVIRSDEHAAQASCALDDVQASRVWRLRNRLVASRLTGWLSRS